MNWYVPVAFLGLAVGIGYIIGKALGAPDVGVAAGLALAAAFTIRLELGS